MGSSAAGVGVRLDKAAKERMGHDADASMWVSSSYVKILLAEVSRLEKEKECLQSRWPVKQTP